MRRLLVPACSLCLLFALGIPGTQAARDQTAPVTTATAYPSTNSITVTLTTNESRTTTYYCTGSNCNPTSVYSQPLTFRTTTTLRYYSVDRFRNTEQVRFQTYTIAAADRTAPVTSANPVGGTFTSALSVTLTANEPATIYYCTGSSCSPTTAYSGAIAINATTTLRYYARDTAGNTESAKSQTYTVTTTTQPGQTGGHASLTWSPNGYKTCLTCHSDKANDVFMSVHYQWQGPASEMTNGPAQQGKLTTAVNAYCINTLGNFGACGSCHVGLGAQPSAIKTQAQLENIDCLVCHQKDYKRKKNAQGVFEPDTANMTISMDQAVQSVHRPVRANCLQCHAKGGGGDALKRGDMGLATANTTDSTYDRHMATTGANLVCQNCHQFTNHRVAGRGSDLRPLDSTTAISCASSTCHSDKTGSSGHSTTGVNKHITRVACQTCHIPTYAKNASDSAATEATETHRDWLTPEWNATLSRYEPKLTVANNLKPVYKFFNGTSWGYSMGDVATFDSGNQAYQISRPMGSVADTATTTKLYPFKYKTANQPKTLGLNGGDKLIMLSTKDYFATGNYDLAVRTGLTNMGILSNPQYQTVKTDEYQMLNHQVAPPANALQCTTCHLSGTATQMNLQSLGYGLKKPTSDLCNDCHGSQSYNSSYNSFTSIHSRHVDSQRYDCAHCHNFSRPERGLR